MRGRSSMKVRVARQPRPNVGWERVDQREVADYDPLAEVLARVNVKSVTITYADKSSVRYTVVDG